MITDLGQGIVVVTGTPTISQPISLQEPANALQASVVVYVLEGGETLTLQFQVSEDLENWSNPSTSSPWKQSVSSLGHTLLTKITGIGAPYVRVEYTTSSITDVVCGLTVNASDQ